MDASNTLGLLYVGSQNDYPYLIDRAPSAGGSDHPNHEADVEVVAKPFAARGVPAEEVARRIAACWNALDGFSTPEIEDGVKSSTVRLMYQIRELRSMHTHFEALANANGQTIIKTACELNEVKLQRDELLAALERLEREGWLRNLERQAASVPGSSVGDDIRQTVADTRNAIAKASGVAG